MTVTLDLHRVIPPVVLGLVEAQAGVSWEVDEVTLLDVIVSQVGIGHGGHFDESGEQEEAVYEIVALDDDELLLIYGARQEYTKALRDALDDVTWPA